MVDDGDDEGVAAYARRRRGSRLGGNPARPWLGLARDHPTHDASRPLLRRNRVEEAEPVEMRRARTVMAPRGEEAAPEPP